MLVVSDASPINILIRVHLIGVLQNLFGEVVVPSAVATEMSHPNTPGHVKEWLHLPPSWLHIRSPSAVHPDLTLGLGECEAISLAQELKADLLLVDDLKARRAARQRGLVIMGTLGVLEQAARKGLISLDDAFRRIRQTDFAVSDELLEHIADRNRGHSSPGESNP